MSDLFKKKLILYLVSKISGIKLQYQRKTARKVTEVLWRCAERSRSISDFSSWIQWVHSVGWFQIQSS